MAVRVYWITGRPATGYVVEEQSGKVLRFLVVFAGPPVEIVHPDPFCELGPEFYIGGIAVEFIMAVANKAVLEEVAAADQVVELVRAAADTYVMLGGRDILVVEFVKPVGVCKRTAVLSPSVLVVQIGSIVFRR